MYGSSVCLSFQYSLKAICVAYSESSSTWRFARSCSVSVLNKALMLFNMKITVFLFAPLDFQ